MQNAVAAVCAFTSESKLRTFAIELRAPANQFLDPLRSILDQNSRCVGVAKTIAGIESVLQM